MKTNIQSENDVKEKVQSLTSEQNNKNSSKRRKLKISVIAVALIILSALFYFLFNNSSESKSVELNDGKVMDSLKIATISKTNKKLPEENVQKERIVKMFNAFDNAFTYKEMDAYLNEYFDFRTREKLALNELDSYELYSKKEHKIVEITKTFQNDTVREFQVIFDFKYKKKNGYSDVLRCVDLILIDHKNIIIDRKEEGKLW